MKLTKEYTQGKVSERKASRTGEGPARDRRRTSEARRVTLEGSARTVEATTVEARATRETRRRRWRAGWRRGDGEAALVEARDGRGRWSGDGGGEDGLGTVEARDGGGDGGDRREGDQRDCEGSARTVEARTVETRTVETGTVEAGTISVRRG
ncbi:hypothetical protein Scep_018719 [Stephania cephalantha]|uniref:Uncharacterized protein n=1 Tax=Stephania cephalantha TaxID=152367 RepID=A0AAP0I9K7_9MAGN